jgi:hypothetical protein
MQLHPDKCNVLHITRKTPLQSKYTIHGQVLNNVNSAKYLDLNIHKTLSWDEHTNKVTQTSHLFKQKHQPLPNKHQSSMNAIPHL